MYETNQRNDLQCTPGHLNTNYPLVSFSSKVQKPHIKCKITVIYSWLLMHTCNNSEYNDRNTFKSIFGWL